MTEEKSGTVDHPGIFGSILEAVTGGVSSAARRTGPAEVPLLEAVAEVVKKAVRGDEGTGGDRLAASKAIIMGVVRGGGEKDEAALAILSHAARNVIRHTPDRDGDLAAATKGIVLGAIASARDMGVDCARAASTAAQGALEGAVETGSVAIERVIAALEEPIGGSKVAFTKPPVR